MGKAKWVASGGKSLRHKLVTAFGLMSVIPLLVAGYFVTNYIFQHDTHSMGQVSLIVFFTLWIAIAGYALAKELIMPVIGLSVETRLIAEGNYDTKIVLARNDELGDIADSVNTMTGKIRGYIGELQDYRKKTSALNVRIHRKVQTLTNLMRLGDMISSGSGFEEIAKFAAGKMSEEMYGGFCGIFMKGKTGVYYMSAFENHSDKVLETQDIAHELADIEKSFGKKEYLSVDSRPLMRGWERDLREKLGWMNVIIYPLRAGGEVIGAIVYGNFAQDMEFDPEETGVLRAFEKELVLGYQGTLAAERMRDLEMVDSLTGLYTFGYLRGRLAEEINRSVFYQRPCSLIMMKLNDLAVYADKHGKEKADEALRNVSRLLSGAVPSVVRVGRAEDDGFGLLVPEFNKREAMKMAADLTEKIHAMDPVPGVEDRITVSMGIGENPIDGSTAEAVIAKARENMKKAF
jgi:diguanylate cyclase (GGDEF)-like protein